MIGEKREESKRKNWGMREQKIEGRGSFRRKEKAEKELLERKRKGMRE